jgi:hypothetical protein
MQLAKQLYRESRFIRNYDFQNAQRPAAETAAADLDVFLNVFLGNPGAAWRGTTVNPWQFWRVAVTNRYFYNLLRSLLSAT